MKKLLVLSLVMCFLLASCNSPAPDTSSTPEPPAISEESKNTEEAEISAESFSEPITDKPSKSSKPSFALDEDTIINQLNENLLAVGCDLPWEKQDDIDAEMGLYKILPTVSMSTLRYDNGSTFLLDHEIDRDDKDRLFISVASAGELLRVFHPEIESNDALEIVTDLIADTLENGVSEKGLKSMTLETYDDIILVCYVADVSGNTSIQFITK